MRFCETLFFFCLYTGVATFKELGMTRSTRALPRKRSEPARLLLQAGKRAFSHRQAATAERYIGCRLRAASLSLTKLGAEPRLMTRRGIFF